MSRDFPVFKSYAGKRLHMGICGSVAAFRIAELVRRFRDCGIFVSATLTSGARQFITPLTFEALGANPVYTDMFSGSEPFEHLEPGQNAHAMLVAPATAAALARLAHGDAAEMLACQALAFDGPITVAPAMNQRMWANPATAANVETLQERGFFFVGPDKGSMACGDEGAGRLADLRRIYFATLKTLTEQDMFGKKVMVTLGPTQESWDAVRVWTNNSTGAMGTALALAAWLRGAEVHVVAGPVSQWMPSDDNALSAESGREEDFHRYNVRTAEEMFLQCKKLWPSMDMGIFTAAVADFHPEPFGNEKFKKDEREDGFAVEFLPNADILKTLGNEKDLHQKVMGFAAESGPAGDSSAQMEALRASVHRKLVLKNCDMVVGNLITESFGKDTNRVLISDIRGREEQWNSMPKTDLAWNLLNHFAGL